MAYCSYCKDDGHFRAFCCRYLEADICSKCSCRGHYRRHCMEKDICFRCRQIGHIVKNCPLSGGRGGGQGSVIRVDDVEKKDDEVVIIGSKEATVVAEADGGVPEDSAGDKQDSADTNGQSEAEHTNGKGADEEVPKVNGEKNGTTKDVDSGDIKSKGNEDPVEPVVDGQSTEKKLKLADPDKSEKEESVVEANGETTEVSS